jgi:hypothetical protein
MNNGPNVKRMNKGLSFNDICHDNSLIGALIIII